MNRISILYWASVTAAAALTAVGCGSEATDSSELELREGDTSPRRGDQLLWDSTTIDLAKPAGSNPAVSAETEQFIRDGKLPNRVAPMKSSPPANSYYDYVFDVGQGYFHVVMGSSFWLINDAGTADGDQTLKNTFAAYLMSVGRPPFTGPKCGTPKLTLDHFVVSHRHEDHISNSVDILSWYNVSHIWDPGPLANAAAPSDIYGCFVKGVAQQTRRKTNPAIYHPALLHPDVVLARLKALKLTCGGTALGPLDLPHSQRIEPFVPLVSAKSDINAEGELKSAVESPKTKTAPLKPENVVIGSCWLDRLASSTDTGTGTKCAQGAATTGMEMVFVHANPYTKDANDSSLVIKLDEHITSGSVGILSLADAEGRDRSKPFPAAPNGVETQPIILAEKRMMLACDRLRSRLVIGGHHGSQTSSHMDFLTEVYGLREDSGLRFLRAADKDKRWVVFSSGLKKYGSPATIAFPENPIRDRFESLLTTDGALPAGGNVNVYGTKLTDDQDGEPGVPAGRKCSKFTVRYGDASKVAGCDSVATKITGAGIAGTPMYFPKLP